MKHLVGDRVRREQSQNKSFYKYIDSGKFSSQPRWRWLLYKWLDTTHNIFPAIMFMDELRDWLFSESFCITKHVCKIPTTFAFETSSSSITSQKLVSRDMVTPIYTATTILLWEANEILQRLVRHPVGRELNHKAHSLMCRRQNIWCLAL